MITTTDIANILYRDCQKFKISVIPFGMDITKKLKSPCVKIHSKRQQTEMYWNKSFVEVNLCIPDFSESEADTVRLNELEQKAWTILDDVTDSLKGVHYHYGIHSTAIEEDKALGCHYVNVRLLFEVLNC